MYVTATYHSGKDGPGATIEDGDVLPGRGGLWFDVRRWGGHLLSPGQRVQWRITNTGVFAMSIGKGRGGFEVPQRGVRRWETLDYRGVHMAEAFVLEGDLIVAQSEPFHVVIE